MKRINLIGLLASLAAFTALPAQATVKPNGLFSDGAVLQQGQKIPVFGSADDGEAVTVRLGRQTVKTTASGGQWRVDLKPVKAGGPYTLTIAGASNTVTVKDVLVGEVYLCSGQSNMSFTLGGAATGAQAIASANDPELREFHVPNLISNTPRTDVTGMWQASTPQTAGGFSAVAYFFGRDLRKALGVPIGLVVSEWGGTPAQAWTSAEVLKTLPDFRTVVEAQEAAQKDPSSFQKAANDWYAKYDPGSTGTTWGAPALDTSDWKTMPLPGAFQDAGIPELSAVNGIIWFRRTFDLPAEDSGKGAVLHLMADDDDTTWINGTEVGATEGWTTPREYKVPASLLKPTGNVVAVRVLDTGGKGGIYGDAAGLNLNVPGGVPVALAGPWQYRWGANLPAEQVPSTTGSNSNTPTVLYNGMIAPLIPYGIKGAIWYQGESNTGDSIGYHTLFPAMISDWRSRWGEGNFPFLLVQLAPFMGIVHTPEETAWAVLREAQRQTTLTVPNTGMAVITDSGDSGNIHPTRKEPVGQRLALAAQALVYHQKVEYTGPVYESMTMDGSKVILHFTHAEGLHTVAVQDGDGNEVASAGPLTGFTVAGADRKYVNADAVIAGDTIVVSSPAVTQPAAVRFGWANYPLVNLYNSAGLPASPFQTDPFPAKEGK
jgi:sialate O-acetylesterase